MRRESCFQDRWVRIGRDYNFHMHIGPLECSGYSLPRMLAVSLKISTFFKIEHVTLLSAAHILLSLLQRFSR